jgi:AAA+ ATPase superfamily predicted ATPase
MKNETNIYDIDGNIIRKAGDNHKFTLSEVEKLVDDLTEKVRQNPDNQIYKVYLNNAQRWLYNMYNNMSTEDLKSRLTILQDTIKNNAAEEAERERKNLDELNRTIDKFKEQYDNKPDTTTVLESNDKPVVMDEYVEPIEEIA